METIAPSVPFIGGCAWRGMDAPTPEPKTTLSVDFG